MLVRHSIWLFIPLFIPLLMVESSVDPKLNALSMHLRINSSTVLCTEGRIQWLMSLKEPFYGAIRVYDSIEPECIAQGNGSLNVKLEFRADQCGKISRIVDGKLQYDTVLYLQLHPHLMGPHDHKFNVVCSPSPLQVSLSTQFLTNKLIRQVTSKEKVVEGTESKTSQKMKEQRKITTKVEGKMEDTPKVEIKAKEILKMEEKEEANSKILNNKTVSNIEVTEKGDLNNEEGKSLSDPAYAMVIFKEGTEEPEIRSKQNVVVGENVIMLVKVKLIPGIDSQVTDCIANDGTSLLQYPLIDSDGCPISPNIMPGFSVKIDSQTNHKIFFNNYQAFRFFTRDTVQVVCTVGFCNDTCPKTNCTANSRWSNTERPKVQKKLVYYSYDVFLKKLKGPVKTSETKFQEYQKVFKTKSRPSRETVSESLVNEAKSCISYIHFSIMVLFLVGVLLISIIITICMCVSANELKKRIQQPIPYGRFQDSS